MTILEAIEKWHESGYIQTWYLMPSWKPLRRLFQHIHGIIWSHTPSKTEWGYGGGNFADLHCRWCDQLMRMPIDETFIPEELKEMVKEIRGKEPPKHE